MNEIVLRPLDSMQYQPNIVIAVLLALYSCKNNTLIISKENLGVNEQVFSNFIDNIVDTFKIKNLYPLIDKIENKNTATLKIDGFRFDQTVQREVQYTQYFREMFKSYVEWLKHDLLRDSHINQPSWKTIFDRFINSIDTNCILGDYKLQGLQHIQVIAYYTIMNKIQVNWLKIVPNLTDNSNITADSYWNVSMSVSLNRIFQKIEDRKIKQEEMKTKKLFKYSAKEIRFMNYVNEHIEPEGYRIEPDEVLEALNPDGHIDGIVCKNPRKYVSNFISRLNKKHLHNTGRRFVTSKEFRNCYFIENNFEDNEDF